MNPTSFFRGARDGCSKFVAVSNRQKLLEDVGPDAAIAASQLGMKVNAYPTPTKFTALCQDSPQ
jgi:hypothetical protein